jgi:GH25 family lysozyme M1 (1,4-beta-N-acetylmuramidase)
MSKYFIDISENNTILSYAAIPSCNLSGVIIKATEGTTYIDHMLEINYNALSKDLAIGFYHFLTSSSSPITQAQNFWNKIKDKEYQIMPV